MENSKIEYDGKLSSHLDLLIRITSYTKSSYIFIADPFKVIIVLILYTDKNGKTNDTFLFKIERKEVNDKECNKALGQFKTLLYEVLNTKVLNNSKILTSHKYINSLYLSIDKKYRPKSIQLQLEDS